MRESKFHAGDRVVVVPAEDGLLPENGKAVWLYRKNVVGTIIRVRENLPVCDIEWDEPFLQGHNMYGAVRENSGWNVREDFLDFAPPEVKLDDESMELFWQQEGRT